MFNKQRFARIKICNFVCVGAILEENTYIESTVMQVLFINECKSCEISNQMFFNVMFSFLKTDGLVMTLLQNKIIQWCLFAWCV